MVNIMGAILGIDKYVEPLLKSYGFFVYPLLFLVIFAETGFVIIPFLPGDTLLFVAGTLASTGALKLYLLLFIFSLAAILGDTVNYWIGDFFGVRVFSKYISKENLDKTQDFYHKHGAKTIVIARFIPVIRSFAPFVAGVGKMNYQKFLSYNIMGGILWVFVFVLLGYFFGNIPFIKDHLTLSVIIILIISFIPAIIEYFKFKKK